MTNVLNKYFQLCLALLTRRRAGDLPQDLLHLRVLLDTLHRDVLEFLVAFRFEGRIEDLFLSVGVGLKFVLYLLDCRSMARRRGALDLLKKHLDEVMVLFE